MTNPILIIAGPTASGKSGLALEIAALTRSVIINADAIQLYKAIPILSAQPSASELTSREHALYGILLSNHSTSVAEWLDKAYDAIDTAHAKHSLPIIVGGTGMYLKSLIYGLAEIPSIAPAIRQKATLLLKEKGHASFHAMLLERDPLTAGKLHPNDTQRMIRAYEVFEQTGIPLATWQSRPATPRYKTTQFLQYAIMPPRLQLYSQCNERFIHMIKKGAIEEVEMLSKEARGEALPPTRALGFKEIERYLKGELTLEQAIIEAQTATRHYAKRQVTWCRHQLQEAHILSGSLATCTQTIKEGLSSRDL